MSAGHDSRSVRHAELLIDRALAGLSEPECAELAAFGAGDRAFDEFERAAAALDLALFPPRNQALPAALRARILACAPPTPTRSLEALLGSRWGWLAAAVLLLTSVAGWWPRGGAAQPRELLARLEQADAHLLRLEWAAQPDPAARGARGAVIWSAARQEGYLEIEGLAANDPKQEQYQLWIFDETRPSETPVDGGVFDMPAGGALIPIQAKLAVGQAAAFAITIERPGGVVVSKRERIVLLAKG